eukprot:scaffold5885_cov201-Amphora_coffeaeformis.AAC.6
MVVVDTETVRTNSVSFLPLVPTSGRHPPVDPKQFYTALKVNDNFLLREHFQGTKKTVCGIGFPTLPHHPSFYIHTLMMEYCYSHAAGAKLFAGTCMKDKVWKKKSPSASDNR